MLKLLSSKERKFFYLFIFLLSIFSLLEVFNLSLILPILENVLNPDDNKSKYLIFLNNKFGEENFLFNFTLFFLLIVILKNVYLLLVTFFQNKFIYNFKFRLTNSIFDKVISFSYLFFHKENSSSYIKNLIGDTNQISQSINMLITFLSDLLILIFVFSMLLLVDTKITIITFLILSFTAIFYYFFFKRIFKVLGKKRYEYEEALYKVINNTLGAFIEINLFKKKNFFFNKYFVKNNLLNNQIMEKYSFLQTLPRIFFELIGIILLVLLFIYYQKSSNISLELLIPKMSLFVICLIRLMPLFNRMTLSIQNIKFANQTAVLLFNNLSESSKRGKYKNFNNINQKINFTNSSLIKINNVNYEIDNKKIIKNLNFEFFLWK